MLNITTIKSRSRALLNRLDSFVKALDHDPRDHMIGRLRELEREVEVLKAENAPLALNGSD